MADWEGGESDIKFDRLFWGDLYMSGFEKPSHEEEEDENTPPVMEK